MRLRRPHVVVVPPWSNFGIGYQLLHGETVGDSLGVDAPMPAEDVLRAAWGVYRERVVAMCPEGHAPWAARFDEREVDPEGPEAMNIHPKASCVIDRCKKRSCDADSCECPPRGR